jgi:hypothetical protein
MGGDFFTRPYVLRTRCIFVFDEKRVIHIRKSRLSHVFTNQSLVPPTPRQASCPHPGSASAYKLGNKCSLTVLCFCQLKATF